MKYVVQLLVTLHTDQPDDMAAQGFADRQAYNALNYNGEVDPQSLQSVEVLDVSAVTPVRNRGG